MVYLPGAGLLLGEEGILNLFFEAISLASPGKFCVEKPEHSIKTDLTKRYRLRRRLLHMKRALPRGIALQTEYFGITTANVNAPDLPL